MRDDRGKRVPIHRDVTRELSKHAPEVIEAELESAPEEEHIDRILPILIVVYGAVLVIVALVIWLGLVKNLLGQFTMWILGVIAVPSWLAWHCAPWEKIAIRIFPNTKLANQLRKYGVCASCLYRMSDLTPESDGCTVCPECGAAWKLESKDA